MWTAAQFWNESSFSSWTPAMKQGPESALRMKHLEQEECLVPVHTDLMSFKNTWSSTYTCPVIRFRTWAEKSGSFTPDIIADTERLGKTASKAVFRLKRALCTSGHCIQFPYFFSQLTHKASQNCYQLLVETSKTGCKPPVSHDFNIQVRNLM